VTATDTLEAPDLDERITVPPDVPTQAIYDLMRSLGYGRDESWAVVRHAQAFNTVECCNVFRLESHRDAAESFLSFDPEFERYDNWQYGLSAFALSLEPRP
jgi:hypothetical protein